MKKEQDLRQPPLQLEVLGDIKRLIYHLNSLKFGMVYPDPKVKYCLTQSTSSYTIIPARDSSPVKWSDTLDISSSDDSSSGRDPPRRLPGLVRNVDQPVGAGRQPVCSSCQPHLPSPKSNLATTLNPERWKLALAISYALFVSWLTAFVMTVVHDRVPDMNKYPPLPDIILDNVPHIPWAFEMTEITGMTLLTIWLVVILFHKHRFIIARRFFAIAGTIFLLRCFTMIITSLSVPGVHLDCK